MKDSKFIVDFSGIDLSEDQRKSINQSIQEAALRELGKIDTKVDQFGILTGNLGAVDPFRPKLEWYGLLINDRRNFLNKPIEVFPK